jgi:hypothetical protein
MVVEQREDHGEDQQAERLEDDGSIAATSGSSGTASRLSAERPISVSSPPS